jgi:hypothetical protein
LPIWILAAIAAVALFVLFLVMARILGARLPVAHVARVRGTYHQDPQAIWDCMMRLPQAPNWRSGIKQIERLPDRDGHQVWVEVSRRGRLTLVFETVDAPHRLVTRIADEKLPFGGTWTFEIAPAPDGCTVTITEDGEIYAPMFRFMARRVFGYHGMLTRYLRDLGKNFGEKTRPERLP